MLVALSVLVCPTTSGMIAPYADVRSDMEMPPKATNSSKSAMAPRSIDTRTNISTSTTAFIAPALAITKDRGWRSARAPEIGPNIKFGPIRTANATPVRNADPVSSRTNQPTATCSNDIANANRTVEPKR